MAPGARAGGRGVCGWQASPDDQFHAYLHSTPILITHRGGLETGSPPWPIQPWYCQGNGQGGWTCFTLVFTHKKCSGDIGSVVKNPPADAGSIPDLGRAPGGGGNDNQLQFSCLGNPMPRGAWWVIVHGVRKESDMTQ